jgi:DNA-binding LytR/AlgR family response regulator
MTRQPDAVTPEYIEARRLGVLVRTPIENIAFFQAEHKAVVAHTKTNGSFVLDVPLCEIAETLKDKATTVHRAYLVPNDVLPGLKSWRKGEHWVFEIITSVRRADGMVGLIDHVIPVARRSTNKVRKLLTKEKS